LDHDPRITTQDPGKICDLTYLFNTTRGNNKAMHNIITVFLEETPGELAELQLAAANADHTTINSIMHKIRSAFSLLGITVHEPIFKEMEQLICTAPTAESLIRLSLSINGIFNKAASEMILEIK
jgi:HPt (histidine-containing phosphotransfer) domain-containing protein